MKIDSAFVDQLEDLKTDHEESQRDYKQFCYILWHALKLGVAFITYHYQGVWGLCGRLCEEMSHQEVTLTTAYCNHGSMLKVYLPLVCNSVLNLNK